MVWIQWWQLAVAIRVHNLDVSYKSLTCDDLPTDVAACEQAVGRFMIPEMGLLD